MHRISRVAGLNFERLVIEGVALALEHVALALEHVATAAVDVLSQASFALDVSQLLARHPSYPIMQAAVACNAPLHHHSRHHDPNRQPILRVICRQWQHQQVNQQLLQPKTESCALLVAAQTDHQNLSY